MRSGSPWAALGCGALLAACGLSTVGLESVGSTPGEVAGLDATAGDEGAAPGADAASDVHRTTDGSRSARDGSGDATHAEASVLDGAPDGAPPPDDGGGGDGTGGDALAQDAAPDSTEPGDASCDPSAGCVDVPSGWTLVAFVPDQSTDCPSGFGSPQNLVEGADASTACVCDACTVTGQPSCPSGPIDIFYDYVAAGTPGLCSTPGMVPQLTNNPAGACGNGSDVYKGSYIPFDLKYVPPAATGGTCSAPGTATGTVTYAAHDRTCLPLTAQDSNCAGTACTPALGPSYRACIMQSGEVPCPAGPLSVQRLAGSGVSFGCSACGCSVTASCTGQITLYTDGQCTNAGIHVPADGSCNRVTSRSNDAGSDTFTAYTYTGNAPASVACSASGTSTAQNVALAGPVTICCAP
jgi:hypothetical protein